MYLSAALSVVNSGALRHVMCAALCNFEMRTVEETRRERLKILRQKHTFADMNRAMGLLPTDSTLSQINSESTGSKTGEPKTMGSDMARRLEVAMKLEVGWMDNDPAFDLVWPFAGRVDPKEVATLPPEFFSEAVGALNDAIRRANIARGKADQQSA